MSIETYITVAIGVYEVLSRIIPTSKTWSIVGNVLTFIHKISSVLDVKKK